MPLQGEARPRNTAMDRASLVMSSSESQPTRSPSLARGTVVIFGGVGAERLDERRAPPLGRIADSWGRPASPMRDTRGPCRMSTAVVTVLA
jgi:hypothetical protein